MRHPEDAVWDAITDSAKNRFDYASFKADIGNPTMAENILFSIIFGCAERESAKAIAEELNRELLPLALSFPEECLQAFLTDNQDKLKAEILATKMAVSFLSQGCEIHDVLAHARRILVG